MLFMVIEHFRPGQPPEVLPAVPRSDGWRRTGPLHLERVDLDRRCFQVMEEDSEALLSEWTANWDDLVEFEIVPVRTSAEAGAAMGQLDR